MHMSKFAVLAGLLTTVTQAQEKPACGVLPTVFVTVPALEVTKTVVISFDAVLSDTNIKTTPVSVQSSTDVTTTVTNYLTLTQVINLVQATSTSIETSSTSSAVNQVPIAPTSIGSLPVLGDTIIRFQSTLASVKPSLTPAQATKDVIIPDQGPYYFTVNHGTTFWLNSRTPPGGVSYKTSTTVVTLEPVPLRSSDLAEASVESTTYSTLSLTTVITRFSTVEILKVLPTPTISTKLSVSLGSTGWNATTATLLEHEVGGTLAKSTLQQTVVQKEVAGHLKLQGILPASTYPVNATKTLNIRQIGSTVIATIEGVVVSWINDFTGASETSVPVTTINGAQTPENILTTAISTATEVPIYPWNLQFSTPLDLTNVKVTKPTDAPIYPWDLQQSSTLLELTNGKFVTTPTVIPIYPWDSQPFSTPVALAISSPSSQTFSSSLSPFQSETATIQPSISSDIPKDIESKFQTFLRTIPTITTASTASLSYVPSSSSATNDDLNFSPSLLQPGIGSIQPSIPPNFQHDVKSTFLTSLRASTTTFATSIISLESVHSASQQATAISSFVNTSNISAAVQSTRPISCNGRTNREATFTIDFDDLPHFAAGHNVTAIPPIFNPYRKLFFEDHYGYVPPPSDPFPPHSPPQLAIYRANAGLNVDDTPDGDLESVGEFGAGPRGLESAYWIDAYSVWLGCASEGQSDCIVTINGYQISHSSRAVFQTVNLPPCPGLVNCTLTYVEFAKDFRNLVGIQILAAADGIFTVYYMDDLELAWSNNTCAAQTERARVP